MALGTPGAHVVPSSSGSGAQAMPSDRVRVAKVGAGRQPQAGREWGCHGGTQPAAGGPELCNAASWPETGDLVTWAGKVSRGSSEGARISDLGLLIDQQSVAATGSPGRRVGVGWGLEILAHGLRLARKRSPGSSDQYGAQRGELGLTPAFPAP